MTNAKPQNALGRVAELETELRKTREEYEWLLENLTPAPIEDHQRREWWHIQLSECGSDNAHGVYLGIETMQELVQRLKRESEMPRDLTP